MKQKHTQINSTPPYFFVLDEAGYYSVKGAAYIASNARSSNDIDLQLKMEKSKKLKEKLEKNLKTKAPSIKKDKLKI